MLLSAPEERGGVQTACPRCRQPVQVPLAPSKPEEVAVASVQVAPTQPGAFPPAFGHHDDDAPPLPKLKSLAQNAREKELKVARIILLILGALMVVIHLFLFIRTPIEVAEEINKQVAPLGGRYSPNVDQAALKQIEQFALLFGYGIYAGGAIVGLALVVCGLLIKKFPLVTSILSLSLYLAFQLIITAINPPFLIQGIIVKIIIVVVLIKAIQAAAAYERERNAEAELRPEPGTL